MYYGSHLLRYAISCTDEQYAIKRNETELKQSNQIESIKSIRRARRRLGRRAANRRIDLIDSILFDCSNSVLFHFIAYCSLSTTHFIYIFAGNPRIVQ